jgi:hypothetical protein
MLQRETGQFMRFIGRKLLQGCRSLLPRPQRQRGSPAGEFCHDGSHGTGMTTRQCGMD